MGIWSNFSLRFYLLEINKRSTKHLKQIPVWSWKMQRERWDDSHGKGRSCTETNLPVGAYIWPDYLITDASCEIIHERLVRLKNVAKSDPEARKLSIWKFSYGSKFWWFLLIRPHTKYWVLSKAKACEKLFWWPISMRKLRELTYFVLFVLFGERCIALLCRRWPTRVFASTGIKLSTFR